MIDLREEFGQLLGDYGYYILLQRSNRKVHCRCWDPRYMEPQSDCMYCNGSGWVVKLERHICRSDPAMQPVTYPNLNAQSPQGEAWIPAESFFLTYSVKPQVGDYVYVVGWRGRRPTNLFAAYEINHVQPQRGDRGRVEYYKVSVKRVTMGIKRIIPRVIGGQVLYEAGS